MRLHRKWLPVNFAANVLVNAWVSAFVLLGYFFGGVPFVQQHFSLIVIGIVFISVLPAIIGAIRGIVNSRKK